MEVVELIEAYGIGVYPINVFALAAKMGIVLRPYSSIPFADRAAFVAVSKDAFTIADGKYETDTTFICFNENSNRSRLRQSICHEIAHIWLEHVDDEEPHETEAEYFAAYLLAPIPLILKHTDLSINEISSLFDVSYDAARIAAERARNRIACRKPVFQYEHTLTTTCGLRGGGFLESA